ncbi:MAG TPA: D-aminoacyl-tRNA deacylase [Bacteroidales bacterium]|nr:D-aminoacyl-tRNA deacylase [Bacteroidales bacterium]
MRILVQRVKRASVTIDGELCSATGPGILVFLGIEEADTDQDVLWLAPRLVSLRIFDDTAGVMNISAHDAGKEIMVISQFTLHASTKRGNRPSYIRAAKPEKAIPLYEQFIRETERLLGRKVMTGRFGAMMDVELVNNGPVTIFIDSKNRE